MRRDFEPEYRRRVRKQTEDEKEESNRKRWQGDNQKWVERILASIGAIYSQRERHKTDEDRQWRYERFFQAGEIFALVAAAVVGVVAIVIGTHDAKEQRTIMGGQLTLVETDQRPWIKVDIEKFDD